MVCVNESMHQQGTVNKPYYAMIGLAASQQRQQKTRCSNTAQLIASYEMSLKL